MLRQEMEEQLADYLRRGGKVQEIANGVSGREDAREPLRLDRTSFDQKPQERTFLPDVVAAIDARSAEKKNRNKTSKPTPRPQKKPIYDDFGEILRWEWVDD